MNKERIAKVRKNYRLSSETIEQMQVLIGKLNGFAENAREATKMPVMDWNETSLIEYLIRKEFHQYENQVPKSSEGAMKGDYLNPKWLPDCDQCGRSTAEVFLVETEDKALHYCGECFDN